ncbi:hypothetical protein CPB83DRAFT_858230 [Crepidotus variabilis]|uniref:Glycosyltransferase 61 catalytic domain-containing protein n=1 Tax=Crepidotus variabilis TaxID=179855 RepID=A0A9P6EBX2_9AGAR|nr:hypothetical protein CPB83DRAFT_858230 [Crepidotus variabilis]
MFGRTNSLTRRDAILLLIGATSLHVWNLFFPQYFPSSPPTFDVDAFNAGTRHVVAPKVITQKQTYTETLERTATTTATVVTTIAPAPTSLAISPHDTLPSTEVLAHAPGWTLFRNLYMSNGTLIIVTDENGKSKLPPIRMMASVSLEAVNSPENIAAREPNQYTMDIIDPQEASKRWTSPSEGDSGKVFNRVWTVEGSTFLVWDPVQFLRHYFHFVAELFFGLQAFWHGAWSQPIPHSSNPDSAHFSTSHPSPPPIDRVIFAYSNANGWRDDPGFNRYFLRAAFPSMTVEHEEDWQDRVVITRPTTGSPEKAFHFPLVVVADRSASHRGVICGTQVQRTASEAWDLMRQRGKLMGIHVGGWWAPIREAIWRFAGAEAAWKGLGSRRRQDVHQEAWKFSDDKSGLPGMDEPLPTDKSKIVDIGREHQKHLSMPEKIVISYISRQTARTRRLAEEDHNAMVRAVKQLVSRKNDERRKVIDALENDIAKRPNFESHKVPLEWEFQELIAERMTKDEQIRQAARTTILLGLHGNGLTHLVFMDPNQFSTVIELFYPGGFAHDYYWTSRSLGMTHMAVWNDSHTSFPQKPEIGYPDGFHGWSIPVHGPYIAQVIEDRVSGKL